MTRLKNKTYSLNKRWSRSPNNILCQHLHLSEVDAIYPYDYLKIIFIVLCAVSSSGDFNSEFDTYLLTSVKYRVQRPTLYKEFSSSHVYIACSCTQISSVWIHFGQKQTACWRTCDPYSLGKTSSLFPSSSTTQGRRRRQKGNFPNYDEALLHKCIPSISFASSNCSSQTTLCHLSPHTHARSFLSDLLAQTPTPSLSFQIASS